MVSDKEENKAKSFWFIKKQRELFMINPNNELSVLKSKENGMPAFAGMTEFFKGLPLLYRHPRVGGDPIWFLFFFRFFNP